LATDCRAARRGDCSERFFWAIPDARGIPPCTWLRAGGDHVPRAVRSQMAAGDRTVGNGPTWPKRTPSRSLGQAVRKDRFGAWAPNCQPSDAPEIPQPQSAEGAPLPRPHSGVPTTGTDRLSLFRRPFRGKEHHAEDAIAREKSKAFYQCAHTRAAAVVGSGETRLSEGWSASLLRLSPR
jgi:hypothetical protein